MSVTDANQNQAHVLKLNLKATENLLHIVSDCFVLKVRTVQHVFPIIILGDI